MGHDLGAQCGPHLTERESTERALEYSLELVRYYRECVDVELAEVTRLQAKLAKLKEGEGEPLPR